MDTLVRYNINETWEIAVQIAVSRIIKNDNNQYKWHMGRVKTQTGMRIHLV